MDYADTVILDLKRTERNGIEWNRATTRLYGVDVDTRRPYEKRK